MPSSLYVGNLAYSVTGEALNKMFSAFGTVESAKVITDRETGSSKGFGFVDMSSLDEANAAINELNGKEIDGRKIAVNIAKPKEDRPRNSSFGGGNRPRRDGFKSYNRN